MHDGKKVKAWCLIHNLTFYLCILIVIIHSAPLFAQK
jgi:hypothetical protein